MVKAKMSTSTFLVMDLRMIGDEALTITLTFPGEYGLLALMLFDQKLRKYIYMLFQVSNCLSNRTTYELSGINSICLFVLRESSVVE